MFNKDNEMPTAESLMMAAQIWCQEPHNKKIVDIDLVKSIATLLDRERQFANKANSPSCNKSPDMAECCSVDGWADVGDECRVSGGGCVAKTMGSCCKFAGEESTRDAGFDKCQDMEYQFDDLLLENQKLREVIHTLSVMVSK